MSSQREKCEQFADLHQQAGAFLIPNPWDVGSASLLQGLGFKALATSSAGFAYALGKRDGEVSLAEKLQHCRALAEHTRIPLSVDFENGFSEDPAQIGGHIVQLAATGVAGCSIEDFSRETQQLYDFELALARVEAAVAAVATLDMPFQLTARAENLLRGVKDMGDTIRRLQAFEAAGAHVLYAPGLRSLEQVQGITAEISAPFNVLAPFIPEATVADFAAAGAKRISLGSALTLACLKPLLAAGREMLDEGSFTWTAGMVSSAEVNALMS